MEGEVESKKSLESGGFAASFLDRLLTRETAIAFAFALITFLAYWNLGPKNTAYSYQISQSNNLIHGHLDLREEYSHNLNVLERVLFDGDSFCLPPEDAVLLPTIKDYTTAVDAGTPPEVAAAAVISADCKLYATHAIGPAFVVLPGTLIWGRDMNQALVSAVIGALTSLFVYAIAKKLTRDIATQIGLTALMMFGTIFFYVAANGGAWFFAHTMAVFFLFAAIYATVVHRNPFVAGACLGAAHMCRAPVIMNGLFFVVMFSDLFLRPRIEGKSFLSRIDLRPALEFAAGIVPILIFAGVLNYIRYSNPLEYGYSYIESAHQNGFLAAEYTHGTTLSLYYLQRHPGIFFAVMPVFLQTGPWVVPTFYGMAVWVSTPAFLIAFFANIKKNLILTYFGVVSLALTAAFMLSKAIANAWHTEWSRQVAPKFTAWGETVVRLDLLPFWLMTAVAVAAALYARDKISIACWAAIIPTVFILFSFAFVGYAQFGYRYSLDFTPFLWLLVAHAVGDKLKWHHWALIGASIIVNLWGVLWIYQFAAHQTNGWMWTTF